MSWQPENVSSRDQFRDSPTRLRLVTDDANVHVALLNDFAIWLRSWNASPATIDKRLSVVRTALLLWGDPAKVTADMVGAFLAQPTFAAWTRVTYFGHLRSFFAWAEESGRVPTDPTRRMRTPRARKGKPRPLTPGQVEAVLAAAKGDLRAWLQLGLLAGLRVHEVAKLRGEDVTASTIFVRGKGGKDAFVPTHPDLWALAADYPRYGWWFPRPTETGHVSGVSITCSTTRLFKRLGIEGSHHRCRHTYGTTLLRNGANLRVVQELMRHESVATTEIYTQVTTDELTRAIASLVA